MPILKWGFPTQSRNCQFTGVNNAGLQTYGSNPISSIVREAVQNSLDAAISPTQTVEIDISYGVIKKEIGGYEDLFNALLSVEEHVSMCKKDYEEASKYNEAKYFDGMLKAINRFRSLGRIPYLRIKDSGTIGMYHNDANPRSGRLCTFIHGDGENNADNQNGGGANGIGKMAYFALSPLNMVLVSTHAIETRGSDVDSAETFFSGTVKLTTHNKPDNEQEQYQYAGYMPAIPADRAFAPLCGDEINGLPFLFTRRPRIDANPELGSTIFIIGCEPDGVRNIHRPDEYDQNFTYCAYGIYDEMAESVLRNYWLAIYKNRISIKLGMPTHDRTPIEISDRNIADVMCRHFNVEKVGKQLRNYNPLHFMQALDKDNGEHIVHYELNLDAHQDLRPLQIGDKQWGRVRLYLNIDEAQQGNLILGMRSPLMTVCRFDAGTNAGSYAGVLVCDEEGNYCDELLRASEPHTHDKWDERQAKGHGYDCDKAKILIGVIRSWVAGIINDLFVGENANAGRFMGMSDYLCFYDPEDPSQRDSNLNKRNTAMCGETSTIKIKEQGKKESKGTKVSKLNQDKTSAEPDGDKATGGGGSDGTGGTDDGYAKPDRKVTSDPNGKQSIVVSEVNLKTRYYALQDAQTGDWVYTIILYGNGQDYEKIALRIEEQKELRSHGKGYLCIKEATEGEIYKKDETRLHCIGIAANELKKITIKFKMCKRRFALRITSTLDNEFTDSETYK